MKKVLITGGNGNLGLLLAERLNQADIEVIRFDLNPAPNGAGREVLGDIRDIALIEKLFETHAPDSVIHLASLLSGSSEDNLKSSWEINATASFQLLNLASERGMSGPFVFASTIASYGPEADDPLPENAEQWPRGIYGATKVAVERLGYYFKTRHGLDFRCLRFPLVLSPFAPPSAMTAYPSHAFLAAAQGQTFTFPVAPEVGMSTMFLDDVVRSLAELGLAERSRLRQPAYNLHSFYASARDIEMAIKARWQGFECGYAPNAAVEAMLNASPDVVVSDAAARDWDWAPAYDLSTTTAAMFDMLGVSEGAPE